MLTPLSPSNDMWSDVNGKWAIFSWCWCDVTLVWAWREKLHIWMFLFLGVGGAGRWCWHPAESKTTKWGAHTDNNRLQTKSHGTDLGAVIIPRLCWVCSVLASTPQGERQITPHITQFFISLLHKKFVEALLHQGCCLYAVAFRLIG